MSNTKNRLNVDLSGLWFRHVSLIPPGAQVIGTAHLGDSGPPGALVVWPDIPSADYPFSFQLLADGHYPQDLVTRKTLAALGPLADQLPSRAAFLAPYLSGPAPTPKTHHSASKNSPETHHSEIQNVAATPPIRNVKSKLGRPFALSQAKRTEVYLDEATRQAARALGDGNLSLGIRRAVEAATGSSTPPPEES